MQSLVICPLYTYYTQSSIPLMTIGLLGQSPELIV